MKANETWWVGWDDCCQNQREVRKARLRRIQRVVRAGKGDDGIAPDGGVGRRGGVEAILYIKPYS